MGIHIRKIYHNEYYKAVQVLNKIPEFDSVFYLKKFEEELSDKETIVLLAEYAGKPVGCKIAYNRYFDGSVYSWLGGVLLPYRGQGIAGKLLDALESEAKSRFFESIRFKTRNKHVAMLIFALKNGFQIVGFDKKGDVDDYRIVLSKEL
ncbi:MAG: GNAT family N-acetyltransferase [Prolixibacteraceae bacterium]|jgi:GNAT superfamily N-acetyltransferase|nr:GNAT family N-acetyltransferase [Prolixibacteraceae bacterium]